MALFISFEGGEGSGKSTQAALLAERLREAGRRVSHLREPGSTELGDYLRRWLKSNAPSMKQTHEAELFLFTAARAELVRRVVKPALRDGEIVVCDRYADSTTAYQGYGRGLPLAAVRAANQLAAGGVWPDVTFLLDGAPHALLMRARAQAALYDESEAADRERDGWQRAQDGGEERFERAPLAFHERVRLGYLRLAEEEPERWRVLDAAQGAGIIAEQVWDEVARLEARAAVASGAGERLPGI